MLPSDRLDTTRTSTIFTYDITNLFTHRDSDHLIDFLYQSTKIYASTSG